MKRLRSLTPSSLLALTCLFLAACATEAPIKVLFPLGGHPKIHHATVLYPNGASAPVPPRPTKAPAVPRKPIAIPEVSFRLPKRSAHAANLQNARTLVASGDVRYVVKPTEDSYRGGAVVYNWIPDQIYELFVAPLRLSDITLEPGESLESRPAAGDTSDFIVATAHSVENGRPVVHVLIKALYAGKQTTLEIDTNRRSYTFEVSSYRSVFMPLVRFDYPLEQANRSAQAAQAAASRLPIYGEITDLDFGYKIIPHSINLPHWMPSTVFTDGRRTYIEFASAARASYAPVLFSVSGKGKRTLVNYRVVGDYYVVDQVLEHAELVLDVNSGNIITILKVR